MDLNEIRAFVSVARLRGFGRAAVELNRSQPAISRRIQLIEQEFATTLFERVGGRMRLTTAGQAFLPFAEAALASIEDGRAAVRVASSETQGAVSLALVGTLADTNIVEVLEAFARRSKGVDLDLRTASSQEVSDIVRRGEVTLGLRYFEDRNPDLASRLVGHESLKVICAKDHPLAGRRIQDPRRLANERWIGFPPARVTNAAT